MTLRGALGEGVLVGGAPAAVALLSRPQLRESWITTGLRSSLRLNNLSNTAVTGASRVPIAAILRYQLYDIDRLINRTLVTACYPDAGTARPVWRWRAVGW